MTQALLVPPNTHVNLADYDPAYSGGYGKKSAARVELKRNAARLQELQEVMWAEGKHALLVILQALDAGGKDGTIKHVLRGVNPQGCQNQLHSAHRGGTRSRLFVAHPQSRAPSWVHWHL